MSTDVFGSISGYYKQIYLAVRELLKLENDFESVGIECGADIRLFKGTYNKTAIEVKFLKSNIGLYHEEIYKTVYNFYQQASDDVRMVFITNTEVPNKLLFVKKGSVYKIKKENSVKYVLHLLVKKELSNLKTSIKTLDFDSYCSKCKNGKCQKCINNFVNKGILNFPIGFQKTIKFKKISEVKKFADKLEFVFENQNKLQSISILKEEVRGLLIKKYANLLSNSDKVVIDSIIHKITMKLFDSTVINSLIEKQDNSYSNFKKISLRDVEKYINNYESFLSDYKDDILDYKISAILNDLTLNPEDIKNKYLKQHLDYIEMKSEYEIVNEYNINQYIERKKIKFNTKEDLNNFRSNLIYFEKGFGIIKFLTTLNVAELHVYSDRIFVTCWNNESFVIGNDNYYTFEKVIAFLKDKFRDMNEYYKYSVIENCSYLLSDIDIVRPQTILIRKLGGYSSLSDYHIYDNVPLDTLNALQYITNSKNNILVLSQMNNVIGKINLFNVMLSTVDLKDSVIIFYEDYASLPVTKKDVNTIGIDSLDVKSVEINNESIATLSKGYNKVFLLLDNYETNENRRVERIRAFEGYKGSLITTWHCNIGQEFNTLTLFEIANRLYMESIIPSIFDTFILLDHVYVWDESEKRVRKERIRIISKHQI